MSCEKAKDTDEVKNPPPPPTIAPSPQQNNIQLPDHGFMRSELKLPKEKGVISGQAFGNDGSSGSKKFAALKIKAYRASKMYEINGLISDITYKFEFDFEKSFDTNFKIFSSILQYTIDEVITEDFTAITDGDGNFEINTEEDFIFISAMWNNEYKWVYPWFRDQEGGARVILSDKTSYANRLFDTEMFPKSYWQAFFPFKKRYEVEREKYIAEKNERRAQLAKARKAEAERLAKLRKEEEERMAKIRAERDKKQMEEFYARKEKEKNLKLKLLAKRKLEIEMAKKKSETERLNAQRLEQIKLKALEDQRRKELAQIEEARKLKTDFTQGLITNFLNSNPSGNHKIVLREKKIELLPPLSNFNHITYLDLASNNISDIKPLSSMENLTHLDLSNNSISDISPLAGLQKLTYLDISNSNISDIKTLEKLKQLKTLKLNGNYISIISPLNDLQNLRELNLISQRWDRKNSLLRSRGIKTFVISNEQRFILTSKLKNCDIKF
jgi:hypothetical protein